MKCTQKLCQRNKQGSCKICQDEATKDFKATRKNVQFKQVNPDLKLMIETHKKLVEGIQVDPRIVNILVLGGVVNILSKSEAIEGIESRIKHLEC